MPETSPAEARTWSTLCHLAALAGLVVPSVGAAVGPLVVWLIKRHDHPAIDAAGKDALNFQISMLIYSWALAIVGIVTTPILIGFLFLILAFLAGLAALVLAVIAAINSSNDKRFRYPLTLELIR